MIADFHKSVLELSKVELGMYHHMTPQQNISTQGYSVKSTC